MPEPRRFLTRAPAPEVPLARRAAGRLAERTEWQPGLPGEDPVIYPVQVPCTPTIVYTDGPEAVRAAGVTDFPAQIALASTWNLDLAYDKGVAQAEESFAKRRNVILAPGIGNGRTPLAGRTPEYFGEDTLLNGLFAASHAEGIEADGKVISDLKHFLANEQELDRQTSSSNMDERTLREVYGLPYEIAVDRSTPESVMCAFNQVNGVYICESPLMKDLLKDDYGFDGFIMSDFGSVHSTGASLMNGLDQELNRPKYFTPARSSTRRSRPARSRRQRIDEAAFRVIRSYIRGGLFDNPLPAEAAVEASTPANEAVARQIAEQGSVLLKNEGTLPLSPTAGQTIALFGPTASSTPTDRRRRADERRLGVQPHAALPSRPAAAQHAPVRGRRLRRDRADRARGPGRRNGDVEQRSGRRCRCGPGCRRRCRRGLRVSADGRVQRPDRPEAAGQR